MGQIYFWNVVQFPTCDHTATLVESNIKLAHIKLVVYSQARLATAFVIRSVISSLRTVCPVPRCVRVTRCTSHRFMRQRHHDTASRY